jgi:hypothetical protein
MRFLTAHLLVASLICAEPAAGVVTLYAPSMVILPGAQVVDVAGNPVGTVQSVHDTELILRTDRHEVRLPISSFTPDKGKLIFGMTREALNQTTDVVLAKAHLPGTKVYGKNGAVAGTIAAVDQQYVTVELQSGESVRLPRKSVVPDPKGAVLGITVTVLRRMVEQAQIEAP